jgi:DNA-binding MarR family transcriptional regulator
MTIYLSLRTEQLFEETRLLFHALKHWVETFHDGSGLSATTRGVLELLLRSGSMTVPDMARARGVSRQHVQQQVDALLEGDLVERTANPAHRRSPMIALSDRGRALIQNMRAEEQHAVSRLQVGVSDEAIAEAVQVLAAWRAGIRRDTEARTR